MALNGIDISALILYKNNIQHKQPNKTAYIIDCVNPL